MRTIARSLSQALRPDTWRVPSRRARSDHTYGKPQAAGARVSERPSSTGAHSGAFTDGSLKERDRGAGSSLVASPTLPLRIIGSAKSTLPGRDRSTDPLQPWSIEELFASFEIGSNRPGCRVASPFRFVDEAPDRPAKSTKLLA